MLRCLRGGLGWLRRLARCEHGGCSNDMDSKRARAILPIRGGAGLRWVHRSPISVCCSWPCT